MVCCSSLSSSAWRAGKMLTSVPDEEFLRALMTEGNFIRWKAVTSSAKGTQMPSDTAKKLFL
jgi:hypothetical protein